MKLMKALIVIASLLMVSGLASAQGFLCLIYNDDFPLLASTPTGCNGAPYPDGTMVYIYWDNDSNGPDADDPLADVGEDTGQLNFNQFPMNGNDMGFGEGTFVTEYDLVSVGAMPVPPRYYLVVRCVNDPSLWVWRSEVMTFVTGPQEWDVNDWTCIGSVCADCPVPPQPGAFSASDSQCDGILLTWTYPQGVQNHDAFLVMRAGTLIATLTDIGVRQYLDPDTSGVNIPYQVIAHTSCGSVSLPATDFGTRLTGPPTPSGVSASDATCNQVMINWTYATNAGLDRWVITRNGVPVDSIAHSGQVPGPRTYTHVNAPGGVAQYCVYGSSTACGWGTATCDSGQALVTPAQVQDVSATDGNCGLTTVTWTDVFGETGYNVWRSNADGTGANQIASNLAPNTVSYNDATGAAGVQYRYWVVATNACGTSQNSAFDLGMRLATPGQPTGLTATDGTNCDAVVLSWANVTGEAGFYIYRASVIIDSVLADVLTYSDVTAVPGTNYSYQVAAFNSCGTSTLSAADNGFRGTAPVQVTGVQATDTRCDSIVVTWTAVPGATLYRIRQNGSDIGTVTATRFAHAPAAGTYSYTVAGESPCGTGAESAPESGTRLDGVVLPQVPGVAASDNNCTGVVITWQNIAGEDSFQVRRNGARIGGVAADVLTFTDTTATPFTAFTYRVVGYNACGAGDTTGTDQGTMLAAPAQVIGVAATDIRCDSVVVTWTAVPNAVDYTVFRDAVNVGVVTGTRFAHAPAVGTAAYTVQAANVCGNGPVSAPDNGTLLPVPLTPTGVAATDNLCGSVIVTWTNGGGDVDSFVVYRDNNRVGAVNAATLQFTDMAGAGTYAYTVRAKSNECGESSPSAPDNGTSHAVPGVPTNLAAGPVVCDQVNLNWGVAPGEVNGYVIYRDGVAIDSSATNTYADATVNDAANHSYTVRAYNLTCGEGTASSAAVSRVRELLLAPALPNDTLIAGGTVTITLDHCNNVTSDSVYVSVNNGAYTFLTAFAPVQGSVDLPVPAVQGTTPNNRYRFISTRGTRRDTVETAPFVIEALAVNGFVEIPTEFYLDQNYPNPFNPSTTIRFGVPQAGLVKIEVYDLMGRKAATLVNEVVQPGVHDVIWNCADCPTGTYVLRMQADQTTMLRKMLLMK